MPNLKKKTWLLRQNTNWPVWDVVVCSSGNHSTRPQHWMGWKQQKGANNISEEARFTSAFNFALVCVCLYIAYKLMRTWLKADKEVRDRWKRKKTIGGSDCAFVNVLWPTGEMGAGPGICFQATQHGVSWFGEKWFLLNGHTLTHTQRTRQPWQRWLGLTWKLLRNSAAATQWCCPQLRVLQHEAHSCQRETCVCVCVPLQNISIYVRWRRAWGILCWYWACTCSYTQSAENLIHLK